MKRFRQLTTPLKATIFIATLLLFFVGSYSVTQILNQSESKIHLPSEEPHLRPTQEVHHLKDMQWNVPFFSPKTMKKIWQDVQPLNSYTLLVQNQLYTNGTMMKTIQQKQYRNDNLQKVEYLNSQNQVVYSITQNQSQLSILRGSKELKLNVKNNHFTELLFLDQSLKNGDIKIDSEKNIEMINLDYEPCIMFWCQLEHIHLKCYLSMTTGILKECNVYLNGKHVRKISTQLLDQNVLPKDAT